jgi:hypothetical protein
MTPDPAPVAVKPPGGLAKADQAGSARHWRDKGARPEQRRSDHPAEQTEQSETDMEWLFERDRDAPLGWAFDPARQPTTAQASDMGSGSGSTSTSEAIPAWRDGVRTGRSPWMVFAVFIAILSMMMLLAYLGGMAFSTIVDR